MNREEFLRQLESLLSGISEEERADAMAFYRSYFEDAGEGNEASIIAELESPQKVADSILKDLGAEGSANGKGDSHEAADRRSAEAQSAGAAKAEDAYQYSTNGQTENVYTADRSASEGNKNGAMIITVVLAVLLSPIWLTLILVFACVVLGIVCALFGVAVAMVTVMAALIIVGIVLAVMGIGWFCSGSFGVGLALTGAGLIILALGWLAVVLVVWMIGSFLPWAIKGIVIGCKSLAGKRKERKEA